MPLKFVNLTPFPVTIWTGGKPPKGQRPKETVIPTSGQVVKIWFEGRLETSSELIQLMYVEPRSMVGLPDETDPGTRYVVSESVFRLVEDRKDLVYPSSTIRDGGKPAAYLYLACHPKADVERFFAARGHYTGGLALEQPVKCERCGTWGEEKSCGVGLNKENKPITICGNCSAKDLKRFGARHQDE